MNRLIINQLKRGKLPRLMLFLALVVIFVIIPFAGASLETVQTEVESDVTYYARGVYDILVRAPGHEHPMEQELGLVPENYLGVGDGGISLNQWERIKTRADIEIAAPVSSLGYFTGLFTTMGVFPPETASRYLMQFQTTDGINDYDVGPEYACIQLDSPLEEGEFQAIYNDDELRNRCKDNVVQFKMPPIYSLLAGIDPEQEERLTGLQFEGIYPDATKSGWGRSWRNEHYQDAAVIPVLEVAGPDIPLMSTLSVDRLDISMEDIKGYRQGLKLDVPDEETHIVFDHYIYKWSEPEYHKLVSELLALKEDKRRTMELEVGSFITGFNQTEFVPFVTQEGHIQSLLDDQSEMFREGYSQLIGSNYLNVHYFTGYPQYNITSDEIKIPILGHDEGVPTYRPIEQKGIKMTDAHFEENRDELVSYIIDPIGEIDAGRHEETLSSSPLGIYQYAPVFYNGDEGKKKEIVPTITPGSFVPAPARGVTNIESAAIIKGEQPIDAIRVRVAGIDGYTKDAAEKINQVAQDIEKMGLKATIVAGASPQTVEVNVEGVGLVEQSWTTLGAAGTIIEEWQVTNIILGVLLIVVAVLYVLTRLSFWQVTHQGHVRLMYQLGWQQKHIFRFYVNDLFLVIGLAYVISVPALFVLKQSTGLSGHPFIWQLSGMLLAALFMFGIVRRSIRQVVFTNGSKVSKTKIRNHRIRFLVVKNMIYFKAFIRVPFVQLIIVSILASFVYLSLTETVNETSVTLLGNYVNVSASGLHVLVIIATYTLATLTLSESLLSLLNVREKEMIKFRSIGWETRHILSHYMREVLLWSALAVLIGTVISGALYSVLFPFKGMVLVILLISFAGFYLFLALVSWLIIRHHLRKTITSGQTEKRKATLF
ncbi:ABC transporter permease [Lentibacillus saliphilus]|uniref:ABC transporter permease n=1 Tax=Lentibacillus saliphilus TaxID=2737028 RepID=UPI001C2F3C11|nr:ABC transporter permease [Lentibacillus saliphilus]